jgi:DNA-binding SARP family transcriptional activator
MQRAIVPGIARNCYTSPICQESLAFLTQPERRQTILDDYHQLKKP